MIGLGAYHTLAIAENTLSKKLSDYFSMLAWRWFRFTVVTFIGMTPQS